MVPRRYDLVKTIISRRAHCPLPVNHDVTCQTFHGLADLFWKTWHKRVFYKLVKSSVLNIIVLRKRP